MNLEASKKPTDSFSAACGIFNILRPGSETCEFSIEYKCPIPGIPTPRWFDLRGVLGAMNTIQGNGYLYGGINFDIFLSNHLLLAPGFAAGYYWIGRGKDLGFPLEFRSGIVR